MIQARPTTYRGIPDAIASRGDVGYEWLYEPRAYGGRNGRQYLPDFEVTARYGEKFTQPVFVEVRPTVERAYEAMQQMPVIWESEPTAGLFIWTPLGIFWSLVPGQKAWRIGRT